jgi:peptidoglycan hydrolase-like protein with peptidoglycan-binding domain
MNIAGTFPEDGDEDGVRGLKSLLRATGFTDLDDTPDYDEKTRLAVISLQKKYGIQIDGVVGSSTKIVLYNEDRSLPIPHIVQQEGR